MRPCQRWRSLIQRHQLWFLLARANRRIAQRVIVVIICCTLEVAAPCPSSRKEFHKLAFATVLTYSVARWRRVVHIVLSLVRAKELECVFSQDLQDFGLRVLRLCSGCDANAAS